MRCRICIRLIAWWRQQKRADLADVLDEVAASFNEQRAFNLRGTSWRIVRWLSTNAADGGIAELVWAARRERERRLALRNFEPR